MMYEVIAEKYRGKNKTHLKGCLIPESEIFGSKDVALNGQKGKKRRIDGNSTPDIKPLLKAVKK